MARSVRGGHRLIVGLSLSALVVGAPGVDAAGPSSSATSPLVTEKGTEAGAATAIIDEGATGGQPDSVRASFDRPFLWFIRDRVTGTVLFMGRVVDPSATAR